MPILSFKLAKWDYFHFTWFINKYSYFSVGGEKFNSIIYRMFRTMKTRGDWASFAISLIQKYSLNLSLHDIKNMKTNLFKKLVKKNMKDLALSEIIFRQKKGES